MVSDLAHDMQTERFMITQRRRQKPLLHALRQISGHGWAACDDRRRLAHGLTRFVLLLMLVHDSAQQ
jgi:hypothetical protein